MFSSPPWERSSAKKVSSGTELCLHEGEVMWVKLNCFSYLVQCIQTYFVTQLVCWNFSTGNLTFHKGSLVCRGFCKTVFSRGSWAMAKESWIQFMAHCRVHVRGLYPYYLMHGWVRLFVGPLVYCAISHRQRHFCLWMDDKLLLLREGYDEGRLIQPRCWHHSSYYIFKELNMSYTWAY